MKKHLFLAVAFLFVGLFFWKISYFDFTYFHFYGLIDEIFSAASVPYSVYLFKYIPSLLLLAVYLIALVYIALFFERKLPLFISLFLAEWLLYLLVPKTSFIFIGLAFALGSFMLIAQVAQQHSSSTKLSFFDLSYKGINQFVRYALIILCLYNFVLIKNQPFTVPASVLNTMVNQLEDSLLANSPFQNSGNELEAVDFNASICEREGVNTNACLAQLANFVQTDDLAALATELGHVSPAEINLSEIVNVKIREMLKPYQTYLPYLLTIMFFSTLYFLATFLIFIFAILGVFIHQLLRKIKLVEIDIREVPQEYLI